MPRDKEQDDKDDKDDQDGQHDKDDQDGHFFFLFLQWTRGCYLLVYYVDTRMYLQWKRLSALFFIS